MPTYEYRCKDCGEHLEVVQSFQDDALTECPACGGSLRKVFGSIGISFKGSGFYKTDSRSGSSSKGSAGSSTKGDGADKADKADKGGTGGTAESGSGSKSTDSSSSTSTEASSSSSSSGSQAKSA